MDGIQLGDVNEVCKSNDHFSGMTEVQFSTIGDKFDSCGTRRGINHHFASARGLLDHRGVHGDGAGLESCWSPSGWEHVGSTSDSLENSGAGLSIGRICRAWDCWDNSLIYHGRSVDTHRQFSGSDWGIEEVGLIPGDNQVTSKESFSSSPPTISFTSRASNKLEVAASDIQDDQKSLCVEEKNNWDNKSPHASDFPVKIEMNPGSALVTEQTKSNATIHRSQEMEVRVNSSDRNVPSAFQHNSSHQQVGLLLGDERGIGPGTDEVKQLVKKEMQMDGSASLTGSGDTSIGLKLGKRTYFEDSVASGSNNRGSSGPSLTSSPPGKKQKASSPGTSVPRCQAEGCKADLTNSKDYHRRHKVCECHSKASKVKVADMEQRFCQQCSRFHILSEFDEGKRSCRRRLAGHNERRRKPQPPEGLPLGHCAFLPDYKRLNGNLLDRTCLMQHQRAAMVSSYLHPPALPCQYYVSGAETQPFLSVLSQPATDQMLMLLRSPKEPHSNLTSHEAHEFLQGTGPIMGQGLALSKPPGAIHPSLDAFPASQSLSGIPDSGRALSLLSSSWGSTNPMCSMSLGPSSHSSSLEHFLSENQSVSSQQMVPCTSPPGGQSCFSQIPEKLTAVAPQSCMNLVHGSLDTMDMGQHEGSVNSNFDRRSVLVMLQEHEFQGLQEVGSRHGRPNIDLMQVPSPQSQSSHPGVLQVAAKGRYVELEGLRPYESIFDRQHIL